MAGTVVSLGSCACAFCPCADCADAVPSSWTLTIAGMGNCICTDCTGLNGAYTLGLYDPCNPCSIYVAKANALCAGTESLQINCTFGSTYDSVLDQCLLTFDAQVYTGTTQGAFYSAKWAPGNGQCVGGGEQTLSRTSVVPACGAANGWCDPPATITVKPGGSYTPDSSACDPFYYNSATCLNHKARRPGHRLRRLHELLRRPQPRKILPHGRQHPHPPAEHDRQHLGREGGRCEGGGG